MPTTLERDLVIMQDSSVSPTAQNADFHPVNTTDHTSVEELIVFNQSVQ